MVIVTEFGCPVQEYVDHFGQLVFSRPEVCPHCHALQLFIAHGFYVRKALTATQVYLVRIKRWYCKSCHHTLSLLPSFLLRFRHYLLEVIELVIVTRFEDGASWRQVARRCTVGDAPAPRTMCRWCVSWTAHAPAWLGPVLETLAHHDASSPLLDPLGENAGPHDVSRALLQSTFHLLAWAKTRWSAVANYGLADRLRFLWHWGAGQGLGRLI
jgi:transposase-like protein